MVAQGRVLLAYDFAAGEGNGVFYSRIKTKLQLIGKELIIGRPDGYLEQIKDADYVITDVQRTSFDLGWMLQEAVDLFKPVSLFDLSGETRDHKSWESYLSKTGAVINSSSQEDRLLTRVVGEVKDFYRYVEEFESGFFTTGEVSKITGFVPKVIGDRFDSGILKGFRIPDSRNMGDRRISYDSLAGFINDNGMPTSFLDRYFYHRFIEARKQ